MTPLELKYMLEGHNEVEEENRQYINFNVRRLAYFMVAPHIDKNKTNINTELDMWPHKWDEELEKNRRASLPVAKITYENGQ